MEGDKNCNVQVNCHEKNEQNIRLTKKHIKTLSLLHEIVNENAQLKHRLIELQAEQENEANGCKLASKNQNQDIGVEETRFNNSEKTIKTLSVQHQSEVRSLLEEKTEMERDLKEHILKLRHELDTLHEINIELRCNSDWTAEKDILHQKLKSFIADAYHIAIDDTSNITQWRKIEMEFMAEELQVKLDDVTLERDSARTSLKNANYDLRHLQQLIDENRKLSYELSEYKQKNVELSCVANRLQRDLSEASQHSEASELLEALKNKLGKAVKEREQTVTMASNAKTRCMDLTVTVDQQKTRIDSLEEDLFKAINDRTAMEQEYDYMCRRMQLEEQTPSFKEFVAIKRELNAVKNENVELKMKLKTVQGISLPILRETNTSSLTAVINKGKKKLSVISNNNNINE